MNKLTRRIALGLVMVMTTAFLAGCGTQDKLGYVDVSKVKVETTKGKAIKGKLEAKQKAIYERLVKLQKSESKEKFAEDLQKGRREMQLYNVAMVKEFENSVKASVAQVAREKNLTVVIEKRAVSSGGEDITSDVVKLMNKNTKEDTTTDNSKTMTSDDKDNSKTTTSDNKDKKK